MVLARDCMAAVPEATYRATMLALMGFDLRQRAEGDCGADAVAVGLKGQQRAGADDGEDGELYSGARTMSNSKASAISPISNVPTSFNAAL